uniref:Uncharacterized protein n=1 Tax=Strigamia maritima TaxID=126957 RepID=T1ISX9_STRMM
MRGKSVVAKGVILLITTCNTAGYVLLVKHTLRESERKYYSTTVVLSTEVLKLVIALLMVLRENLWSLRLTLENVYRYKSGWSLGIPALIYAVQNNFLFIGLSNLDAASFQVTNQLKIITTAVFMVVLLKKRFSIAQWIALMLLFVGVVLVQMDSEFYAAAEVESQSKNYWLGLSVVLLTTVTSGFAG